MILCKDCEYYKKKWSGRICVRPELQRPDLQGVARPDGRFCEG